MPRGGAPLRAEQLATVGRIAHERFTSPEIGRLLDDLRDWGEQHEYDSFEASLIRVVSRDWEKARRVPAELRAEMSRVGCARATRSGSTRARTTTSRASCPCCARTSTCASATSSASTSSDEPYDIVLDDFERGMKTAEVRRLFDYVKEHQAPLVKEVAARAERARGRPAASSRSSCRRRSSSRLRARSASTTSAWRLDPTVHPFASGTRHRPTSGSRRATSRATSTGSSRRCTSSGTGSTSTRSTRRSSARRSRAASRSACTSRRAGCGRTSSAARCRSGATSSRACRSCFPDALAGYDAERWYREVNAVEPSLIRVEADEATYNLHIILRFELEQAMLADEFPLEQLPEEWNRAHVGLPRHRGAGRHARASCRTCTGRAARSATSRRTRSAT